MDLQTLHIIETAKRTLTFHPVTQYDLDRLELSQGDSVNPEAFLKRSIFDFLHSNMAIPISLTSNMAISNICEKMNSEAVSVEFSDNSAVTTIFKYVRNLSPGQKVSLTIPPVLSERYSHLQALAYHIRHGRIRHNTVIKYNGNELVLLAKKYDSRNWQLVPDNPPATLPKSSPANDPKAPGLCNPTLPSTQSKN
jgi:hypothetical protein